MNNDQIKSKYGLIAYYSNEDGDKLLNDARSDEDTAWSLAIRAYEEETREEHLQYIQNYLDDAKNGHLHICSVCEKLLHSPGDMVVGDLMLPGHVFCSREHLDEFEKGMK